MTSRMREAVVYDETHARARAYLHENLAPDGRLAKTLAHEWRELAIETQRILWSLENGDLDDVRESLEYLRQKFVSLAVRDKQDG